MGTIKGMWPLLAAQGALTAAGLIGSSLENKKYRDMLNAHENNITGMFNNEMSQDFLSTDVARSTVRELQDRLKKNTQAADQQAANINATEESKIAGRSAAQELYAGALNKLTGYGTQYRDQLRREYQNHLSQIWNMKANNQLAQQQSWQNLMQSAAGLSVGIGEIFAKK